jgi:undecaprenyl-diphosphatase
MGQPQEPSASDTDVEQTLREKLREIKTPEQADKVAQELLGTSAEVKERDLREAQVGSPDPAQEVREEAAEPGSVGAADAIKETAAQIAAAEGETREALEQAAHRATNPEQHRVAEDELREPLELLRSAILQQMAPLQAVDTRAFLAINHLPHTRLSDGFFVTLTNIMNAGGGWLLILLAAAAFDKPRGPRALRSVLPPLWMTTIIVEYPVKFYFRRQRPFIDIVQAVAVGRKPGTYSFPSGHTASAFAGALLLTRHYPQLAPLWYTIAALTGFSRTYLGAHYPGDVLSGALFGSALAEVSRRIIDWAGED